MAKQAPLVICKVQRGQLSKPVWWASSAHWAILAATELLANDADASAEYAWRDARAGEIKALKRQGPPAGLA